jgi:hypothetical protein
MVHLEHASVCLPWQLIVLVNKFNQEITLVIRYVRLKQVAFLLSSLGYFGFSLYKVDIVWVFFTLGKQVTILNWKGLSVEALDFMALHGPRVFAILHETNHSRIANRIESSLGFVLQLFFQFNELSFIQVHHVFGHIWLDLVFEVCQK